jgi:hypothetical protein
MHATHGQGGRQAGEEGAGETLAHGTVSAIVFSAFVWGYVISRCVLSWTLSQCCVVHWLFILVN